jgi:DNA-binding CsgD family transcriptional regulator
MIGRPQPEATRPTVGRPPRTTMTVVRSPTPFSGLVGRDAETQVLARTLDRVTSGRSASALVEGEAGIGKTRLLETTLEEARRRGLRVVSGRAEELERFRPFGLVGDVLDSRRPSTHPRRTAIASMLSEGNESGRAITVTSDPGLQFRVVDAFTDLVEELALEGPLVMGVDDLQWADPSSLLTLGVVGRRLTHLPVAIVGGLRPTPRPDDVLRLMSVLLSVGAEQVTLRPLAADAVRDLIGQLVAAEPGPRLLQEAEGAAGNPLFITELLGALLQDGSVTTTAEGLAEVTGTTLPPSLRLTILHRLAFLPAPTLDALQAASILGSRFELRDLATVTEQSARVLSTALADAVEAHVLEDDGTHLRFRHDLLRESIYQDLPVTIQMGLHREAGQRLADAGAPSMQVAEHLSRGAVRGDREAIDWLTRAAREAAPTSPDTAADLVRRALELMDDTDPTRNRVLVEHAKNLRWAGRIADAEAACRTLLDRHDDASVRVELGHTLLAVGRPREGLEELERAAASPSLDDADRASSLGWSATAHLSLGDLDTAAAVAHRARALATEAADHVAVSVSMSALATVSELRGRLAEASRFIEEAVSLADRSPGRVGYRLPLHATQGIVLMEQDRIDEAAACLEAGARHSEELGMHWHMPTLQMIRALRHFVAGEWDGAVAELDTRSNPSDEIGQTYRQALVSTQRSPEPFEDAVISLIKLHRNDAGCAKRVISSTPDHVGDLDSLYFFRWMIRARALALETEGRTTEALDVLEQYWHGCTKLGYRMEYRSIGPDLARLAVTCGSRELGREVAAATAELAEDNDVVSLRGVALHCRGLAGSDADLLEEAMDVLDASPRPLERAAAAEDAGALLVRHGSVERARPILDRAVEGYESLGAARDLARVEALRRDAGIRRGRRTSRRRPQSGWRSLTPTELTVADLVVEGLSNPQIGDRLFISRRTVQTHLAHIFAKLDIASRSELAARTVEHRDAEPTP